MPELNYIPQNILSQFDPNNTLPGYFDLLIEENKKINLVSRETIKSGSSGNYNIEKYQGLFQLTIESLLPLTTFEMEADPRYLDIGTGGGFPAVPIILTQNISDAFLIERTQKKVAALRRILLSLKKRIELYPVTFEDLKLEKESFDLITLRLVKLTKPIFSKILSLLKPDGTFIYYSKTDLRLKTYSYSKEEYTISSDNKSFTIFKRI